MVRAWCIACNTAVRVDPEAIDSCPKCGARYSLHLLPGGTALVRRLHLHPPIGRATGDDPLEWARLGVGLSMLLTLLLVAVQTALGQPVIRSQNDATSAVACMLVATFLSIRARLVRAAVVVAGVVLLSWWMWGTSPI